MDEILINIINNIQKKREFVFINSNITKKTILDICEWVVFFSYWVSYMILIYYFIYGKFKMMILPFGCMVVSVFLYIYIPKINK